MNKNVRAGTYAVIVIAGLKIAWSFFNGLWDEGVKEPEGLKKSKKVKTDQDRANGAAWIKKKRKAEKEKKSSDIPAASDEVSIKDDTLPNKNDTKPRKALLKPKK